MTDHTKKGSVYFSLVRPGGINSREITHNTFWGDEEF